MNASSADNDPTQARHAGHPETQGENAVFIELECGVAAEAGMEAHPVYQAMNIEPDRYYVFMDRFYRTCITAVSETGELTMALYRQGDGKQWWVRTVNGQFYTAAYGRSRVMSTVGGNTGYNTRLRLEEDRQAAHQRFTYDGTFIQLASTNNMVIDSDGGDPGGTWPVLRNKQQNYQSQHWSANDPTPYFLMKDKWYDTCLAATSETGELAMRPHDPVDKGQWWGYSGDGQVFYTAAYGRSRVMSTVGGNTGYNTRLRLEEDRQAAHQRFTYDGTFIQLASTNNMVIDSDGGDPGGTWPVLRNKQQNYQSQHWNVDGGPDSGWVSAEAMPSNRAERDRMLLNLGNNPYRSTGLYAQPGEVKLSVQSPDGGCPMLYIGAPDTTLDPLYKSQRAYLLRPGLNSISDAGGGMIYVGLIADSGTMSVAPVSGTQKAARFILNETTRGEYFLSLLLSAAPQAELVSPNAIVTVAKEEAQRYFSEDQSALMRNYELILQAEAAESGLTAQSGPDRPAILPYHLTLRAHGEGAVGYATNGYTNYAKYCARDLLVPGVLKDSWLVWHELGHQHEVLPYASPLGEVHVNTFSLAAERAFGRTSRLLDKHSAGKDYWQSALDEVAAGTPYASMDAFERLAFLDQLRLAYGNGFWPRVLTALRRAGEKPPQSEMMGHLAYYASVAVGENLVGPFQGWRIELSSGAIQRITALGLPAPRYDYTALRECQPGTHRALTLKGNGKVSGDCYNGTSWQSFDIVPVASDVVNIRNKYGRRLAIAMGSDGVVEGQEFNGALADQQFRLVLQQGDQSTGIRGAHNGLVLSMDTSGVVSGRPYNGSQFESFRIVDQGDNSKGIRNLYF